MENDILSIPRIEIYKSLFKLKRFDFITYKDGTRHDKQEQALQNLVDSVTREVGYGGAAGGAKSWTGCCWLLFMCLVYSETKYFIAREELKRLKDSTLITFFKVCKTYNVKINVDFTYNGTGHFITFANGSRIDLLEVAYKPSDPLFERYGSSEYTCGWFEEVGEMHFLAYDTLKSRCGRQYNDKYNITPTVFATFNPKKNFVYTYFYKRDKEKLLPKHIVFIKALLYDNPFREKEYAQQLEQMTSVSQKERLLFGNFEYDDNPAALCDYDAICDVFHNDHIVGSGVMYGSADLAMAGRDKFVAGHWNGLVGYPEIVKAKSTGKEIEVDCRGLMKIWKIPHSRFVADSDGMGGYLESYLEGIKEFHGGAKSISGEYVKLKDECAYKLAELINKREIHIVCSAEVAEIIKEELAMLQADDVDADTKKKQIINKDKMKQLLTRSPDFLDWMLMRMFFEIAKPLAETSVYRSRR